jgi:hypothetical protein
MKTKRGIKTPLLFLKFCTKIRQFLVKTRLGCFIGRITLGRLRFFLLIAFQISLNEISITATFDFFILLWR